MLCTRRALLSKRASSLAVVLRFCAAAMRSTKSRSKTTVASAVAVALAERGFQVHLSTTDPAAHLAATIAADEIAGFEMNPTQASHTWNIETWYRVDL